MSYVKKEEVFGKFHELMNTLDDYIGISDLEDAVNDLTSYSYPLKIGRWSKVVGNYVTPGGTQLYACSVCGGHRHLYGPAFPLRKVFCDKCGTVNLYPWEGCIEEKEETQ